MSDPSTAAAIVEAIEDLRTSCIAEARARADHDLESARHRASYVVFEAAKRRADQARSRLETLLRGSPQIVLPASTGNDTTTTEKE